MALKTIKPFTWGIFIGVAFLTGLGFKNFDNDSALTVEQGDKIQYKWYPPTLPQKMNFAGENVPLNRRAIKESLDRELIINYYSHGHTIAILKLATRIFPVIEQRLKANGVPDDFKYLCVAESSLRNPTSRAGAVGYWQFMSGTARHYGLEIDKEVDERYDLIKSTDAACEYLKDAYNKFGNWTAAAASYNCGQGGFERRSQFQRSKNYYDLMLPAETNRYIFRILALKEIIGNQKEYGFYIPSSESYQPIKTRMLEVSNSIPNLAKFAIDNGTSYKLLRILNPWLRSRSLTISEGNSYEIRLPVL